MTPKEQAKKEHKAQQQLLQLAKEKGLLCDPTKVLLATTTLTTTPGFFKEKEPALQNNPSKKEETKPELPKLL